MKITAQENKQENQEDRSLFPTSLIIGDDHHLEDNTFLFTIHQGADGVPKYYFEVFPTEPRLMRYFLNLNEKDFAEKAHFVNQEIWTGGSRGRFFARGFISDNPRDGRWRLMSFAHSLIRLYNYKFEVNHLEASKHPEAYAFLLDVLGLPKTGWFSGANLKSRTRKQLEGRVIVSRARFCKTEDAYKPNREEFVCYLAELTNTYVEDSPDLRHKMNTLFALARFYSLPFQRSDEGERLFARFLPSEMPMLKRHLLFLKRKGVMPCVKFKGVDLRDSWFELGNR